MELGQTNEKVVCPWCETDLQRMEEESTIYRHLAGIEEKEDLEIPDEDFMHLESGAAKARIPCPECEHPTVVRIGSFSEMGRLTVFGLRK